MTTAGTSWADDMATDDSSSTTIAVNQSSSRTPSSIVSKKVSSKAKKRKASQSPKADLQGSTDDEFETEVDEAEVTVLETLSDVIINLKKMTALLHKDKSLKAENKKTITDLIRDNTKLCQSVSQNVKKMKKPSPSSSLTSSITDDVSAIIRDCIKVEMAGIRKELAPMMKKATSSYATVVSNMAKQQPPKATVTMKSRPSIVIAATDDQMSSQDVLKAWRKKVSFKDSGFAPLRAHPVSNNKIRIEFEKASDRDTALAKTMTVPSLSAEAGRQRRPLLIIKGITKEVTSDEVIDVIKHQNQEVALAIRSNDDLKVKFVRRNRKDDLYNIVIEVSPAVRTAILSKERLNIEHQRVHVEDFSGFTQCYKCLQFGHIRAKCTSEVTPCSHCASKDHQFADCPVKADNKKLRCFNCHASNVKTGKSVSDAHSCTSVKDCPVVKQMMQRINERTDYGC